MEEEEKINGMLKFRSPTVVFKFNPHDPKGESNSPVFEAIRIKDGEKLALKR